MTALADNSTSSWEKALLLYEQNEATPWREMIDPVPETSSTDSNFLAKSLLRMITSPTLNYSLPTLENDAKAFKKAVELLIVAYEEGTLTNDEADTMLKLFAERFAMRRINSVFEDISNIGDTSWFLAASYERR